MKRVRVPLSTARMSERMLEATRTASARRAILGKKEYNRRSHNAHQKTAGTRRAQAFVLKRLDAVLAANKAERS